MSASGSVWSYISYTHTQVRLFSFDSISKLKYMPDWCTSQKKRDGFHKTEYKAENILCVLLRKNCRGQGGFSCLWKSKWGHSGLGRYEQQCGQTAWQQGNPWARPPCAGRELEGGRVGPALWPLPVLGTRGLDTPNSRSLKDGEDRKPWCPVESKCCTYWAASSHRRNRSSSCDSEGL